MLQEEILLFACAAGLYLYDSALLLYYNEGVVMPRADGRWAVRFGSTVRMRGRELFVPSPFLPHRTVFRLAWELGEAKAGGDPKWTERRDSFRPLEPLVWGMALALFVLLPLALFMHLGDGALLMAIALLYLNILAAVGWLAYKRASFGLTGRRLLSLAFEAIVCAPFALNLIRKLSSEIPVGEDLVHAARRLQSPRDWEESRRAFVARIEEELESEEEASARARALQAHRQKLLDEGTA